MFTVYHSNKIDTLKILLVHLIKNNPLCNPFDKDQILVQSTGMSKWLKIKLAQEMGIIANIKFSSFNAFIWETFTQTLSNVPKYTLFDRNIITWKLMNILPSTLDDPTFGVLLNYFKKGENDHNLYQLSRKIANIFVDYILYRPEWIINWENNTGVKECDGEYFWQSILWKKLCQYTFKQGKSNYNHANLCNKLMKKLTSSEIDIKNIPSRLFIFGINSLPTHYMNILEALGKYIDIHFMFHNPCKHYWGDICDRNHLTKIDQNQKEIKISDSKFSNAKDTVLQFQEKINQEINQDSLHIKNSIGNSLLASIGKLGRDSLYILSKLESEVYDFFINIKRDTLLHNLQADILNLEERQNNYNLNSSAHKQVVDLDDQSLSIHICHTPMRELEILHDELLRMFNANSDLTPNDIIVMMPNVDTYRSFIHAAFNSVSDKHYISYSISDYSSFQEHPILSLFMRLLVLPNMRCSASELFEFLEMPAVMAKFQFSEKEIDIIKKWIQESGIRWGLDSSIADEFNLPVSDQNTWKSGISRMFLGYAMSEQSGLFKSKDTMFFPYNEVQGMKAEIAGKISYFIEKISFYRLLLKQSQSIDSWVKILFNLLGDFFSVDLEGEMILQSIRDCIYQLKKDLNDAGYQKNVESIVIVKYLESELLIKCNSEHFLSGGVNFCNLIPMRSIPFKVVCLLGMNDGAYPRSSLPDSFNLMSGKIQLGDRTTRDDDRYLFLESILSAKHALYISYIGRSIRDNSEIFPSVLVSELVDYCKNNYCLKGTELLESQLSSDKLLKKLLQYHAMVPFSPSSFYTSTGSYAKDWVPSALIQIQKKDFQINVKKEETASKLNYKLSKHFPKLSNPLKIKLAEFHRFWRLPVQYFFNYHLKVVFDLSFTQLEDNEPFMLSYLENYQIREQLLDMLFQEYLICQETVQLFNLDELAYNFFKQKRAQGILPVGNFGEIVFEKNLIPVKILLDKLIFLCRNSDQNKYEVDTTIDFLDQYKNIHLTGRIKKNYPSGLVRYRNGQIRSQDYLSAWIDHLVMAVIGHSKSTHIIGYDYKKDKLLHFMYLPISDHIQAKNWFEQLVFLFCQGIKKPLPYFPKTALAAVEAGQNRGNWINDEGKAIKRMANIFNDTYLGYGEGNNPYIARIWPKWNSELAHQVKLLSDLVMIPPRLAIKQIK
ncbi:exodeoxyribonuclease V subunit gamma [Candidatus Photodesmus anomalopis]|nr:exodeoxyribonuclease V subunit gamma [Candidatus Photodesmus katoptron]